MGKTVRILLVEDNEDDASLVLLELRRWGYAPEWQRVQTAEAFEAALDGKAWDLVVSDYSMPQFDAPAALDVLTKKGLDIPFIVVSGTVGEETAVAMMKAGAHDYLAKGQLKRLVPAIERELREVGMRVERQRAVQALRISEERFRTLVNSVDEIVFTLDHEGRHDGVFGRWLEREGLRAEHFIGKRARDIFGAEAALPHEVANARALRGEHIVYEWAMETTAGTRHFSTSLSPLRGTTGAVQGLVGLGREITDQKRTQAQLLESDRLASMGTLAAGVAHELNNPLAAVLANLDYVVREVDDIHHRHPAAIVESSTGPVALSTLIESLEEPIREARTAADRVRQIVRDLKVFSRSADDERKGPVNVQHVLESSLRLAWNEIRHRARLVKDYGRVPLVSGNESRLGQVFLNLVVNAAQSIQEGHADENEIRIVTSVAGDGRVIVEIRDTGCGIAPEVRRRLFTPFYTTKPVGVGTGLGLSICHRIVTSIGGSIEVDSALGLGTTFRVLLLASGDERLQDSGPPIAPVPAVRRGRVLVIDDEPTVLRAVVRTIGREHHVLATSQGREALQRISDGERFDVIVCDLMMPHMTGMEFFAELTKLAPDQASRVLFLTGGAFTPSARDFLDTVTNARLEKPFDTQRLRDLVNELLTDHNETPSSLQSAS